MSQPSPDERDALLMEVLVAARRLLALQARAGLDHVPGSLADAIDRDFLLFDLHDAARDLRDAVEAAEALAMLPRQGGRAHGGRMVQAMTG